MTLTRDSRGGVTVNTRELQNTPLQPWEGVPFVKSGPFVKDFTLDLSEDSGPVVVAYFPDRVKYKIDDVYAMVETAVTKGEGADPTFDLGIIAPTGSINDPDYLVDGHAVAATTPAAGTELAWTKGTLDLATATITEDDSLIIEGPFFVTASVVDNAASAGKLRCAIRAHVWGPGTEGRFSGLQAEDGSTLR